MSIKSSAKYRSKSDFEATFRTFFKSPDQFFSHVSIEESEKQREVAFWKSGDQLYSYREDDGKSKARPLKALEEVEKYILNFDRVPCYLMSLLLPETKFTTYKIFANNFLLKNKTDDDYILVSECMPISRVELSVDKKDFHLSRVRIERHDMFVSREHLIEIDCQYKKQSFDKKIHSKIFQFPGSGKKKI